MSFSQRVKKFIEDGKKGTVLFSLGTNMKSEMMDDARKLAILSAFEHFTEFNFLWKYESKKLPTQSIPSNVMITPWLDQNSILAHSNVVAFITHAGLLSTHEAVWWGKPMIGVPIFCDQHRVRVVPSRQFLTLTNFRISELGKIRSFGHRG